HAKIGHAIELDLTALRIAGDAKRRGRRERDRRAVVEMDDAALTVLRRHDAHCRRGGRRNGDIAMPKNHRQSDRQESHCRCSGAWPALWTPSARVDVGRGQPRLEARPLFVSTPGPSFLRVGRGHAERRPPRKNPYLRLEPMSARRSALALAMSFSTPL